MFSNAFSHVTCQDCFNELFIQFNSILYYLLTQLQHFANVLEIQAYLNQCHPTSHLSMFFGWNDKLYCFKDRTYPNSEARGQTSKCIVVTKLKTSLNWWWTESCSHKTPCFLANQMFLIWTFSLYILYVTRISLLQSNLLPKTAWPSSKCGFEQLTVFCLQQWECLLTHNMKRLQLLYCTAVIHKKNLLIKRLLSVMFV